MRIKRVIVVCVIAGAIVANASGAISESQTLVVYNSASAEGTVLKNAYLAAHAGIGASNVVDLNDASLLTANLSIADFNSKVRDPIRSYLSAAGFPQPSDIIAIVLIRPMPHRILDSDIALVGDNPGAAVDEVNDGDITYSSVDSDLVLLWQNLSNGEAGAQLDSFADNMIQNPYHTSASAINAFSRTFITSAKTFANASNIAWAVAGSGSVRLTPGDIYLVCRIDGNTQADALNLITRGQNITVNRATTHIILDEFDVTVGNELDDDPFFIDPGDDYEDTTAILSANGWNVRYDDTFDFIEASEEPRPLIAYASYGENHSNEGAGANPPGSGTYINNFDFAQGAIFNTIESYNARALNGLGTLFNQEQIADFIAAGGTFAVGNVFEPFSVSQPDNEFLMTRLLVNQRTWAEAAYASLPFLSWQSVVLGDPLARFETIVDLEGDCNADIDVDIADYNQFAACLAQSPTGFGLECDCFDFNADASVDLADFAELQAFFD
jgi:uncharacterized protein (TIGR03790 family)